MSATSSFSRSRYPSLGPGPGSYEEFERQFRQLHLEDATGGIECGARAATLARRAGACDSLVTAALVHDFAATASGFAGEGAGASAALLWRVFPDSVLEPLRQIEGGQGQGVASWREHSSSPERAFKPRAERLKGYIDMAASSDDKALSLEALLTIARRTSLDG